MMIDRQADPVSSTGFFISIEGLDGCGKTTTIKRLEGQLQEAGYKVLPTREPGGDVLSEALRSLLLAHQNLHPKTELLLFHAARSQHLQEVILPALAEGYVILCDRFLDATYAYQGGGKGYDKAWIDWLSEWTVGPHMPDLTLLLDVPLLVCEQRLQKRSKSDSYDQLSRDFFTRVREAYHQRAEQYPERIKLIQANRSAKKVVTDCYHHIQALLGKSVEERGL